MPTLALRAPDAHTAAQATITRDTLATVTRLWSLIQTSDLDAGWSGVGWQMVAAVTAGQQRAAALADRYVNDVTAEQGLTAPAEGEIRAAAFAGTAADGRSLDGLLREPVITAKTLIGQGLPPAAARLRATVQLRLLTVTTMQDTRRAAVGAATTARPRLDGHVRVLAPPSCARCVILAGRFYRWSAGFKRHPRCDCEMAATTRKLAGDLVTDPRSYLESLTPAGRGALLGKANAQALQDGADLNQLVNARRQGLSVAGKAKSGATRLTPEAIYSASAGNRGEAIRLLRVHGYIT